MQGRISFTIRRGQVCLPNSGPYHNRLEGFYRLHPGGANRVHLHCHAVGNGREMNGQFVAETLLECVHKALMKYRHRLHRRYYPDIQVKRITSAEHLEKAIVYEG